MDPASILKLAIVGSIVLIVLSIGMSAPPGTLRAGFASPRAIGRAMLSMFVLLPLFTLLVTWALPLEPAARVALLALAVSPMPPIIPNQERKSGGALDFALAIQVAASITALIAAPLIVLLAANVFGRQAQIDPTGIATTILITIIAPLGVGIGIAAAAPALAARLAGPMRIAGSVLLGAGLLIILWKAAPGILSAAGSMTMLAVLLMIVAGLVLGHWLGGPGSGNRHALAIATASRHPGVAIGVGVATDLVPKQPVVAVVLLYVVAGTLLGAAYTRLTKDIA
jgi:bile acid:Na+ symporter, BASS family